MGNIYSKLSSMQKDNDIYLNSIIGLLINTDLSDLEQYEYQRIIAELSLISDGDNSKMIYDSIQFSLFCKENNEPYYLMNGYATLFILYLLGITKLNPIETNCRYETFLGIPSRITKINSFDFRVRKDFHEKFLNYIIDYFSDVYEAYFFSNIEVTFDDDVVSRFDLVDKKANPNEYFTFEKCNGINKITDRKKGNIHNIEFCIGSTRLLNECYDVEFKMNIQDSFKELTNKLLDGDYSVIDINYPRKKVEDFGYFGLDQLVSLLTFHFSLYNTDDNFFWDRDTVYTYFRFAVELPQIDAFRLMESTRKGRFDEKNFKNIFISDDVAKELKACQYLYRRDNIAEAVYYYLLRFNKEWL